MRHPCIVQILGYRFTTRTEGPSVAMAYIDGVALKEVFDCEQPPDWWTPTAKAIIVVGIVLGMRYAHGRSCVHKDLKPQNIFVQKDGTPVIGDFATGKLLELELSESNDILSSLYLAPELCEDSDQEVTEKVDVWSFGIILYEIVMAGICSSGALRRRAMCRMENGERPQIPDHVVPFVRDLIDDAWSTNHEYRPSFADIYQRIKKNGFLVLEGADAQLVQKYAEEIEHIS
jgi:serine/threonine protein kinase